MTDLFDVSVDAFSLACVQLEMRRDDLVLATGTGFLWKQNDRHAIVTCWHCLTGTNPETGRSISRNGARPNQLKITFVREDSTEVRSMYSNLYLDTGEAHWLVHPVHGRKIDIAIYPLSMSLTPDIINIPINELEQNDMELHVGDDLFILGYPLNP
jgi:Trypsin-like peptidase domain